MSARAIRRPVGGSRWRGRVAVVVVVVVVVVAGALVAAGCKRPSRSSAEPWLELTVAVDRTSFAYQQGDRVVLHGAAGERRLRVGTGCLLGGSTLHIIGPSRVLALKQLVKGDPLDQHPERSSAPPCVLDFEARTARPAAELLPGLELEAGAEVVWGRSGNLYVQRRGEPRARVWKDGRLSPLELELLDGDDDGQGGGGHGGSVQSGADRRCEALSRSVQRLTGVMSSAGSELIRLSIAFWVRTQRPSPSFDSTSNDPSGEG